MENNMTSFITLQKQCTLKVVDANNSTTYFSFPTLPSTNSESRLFGCFWTFKYYFETPHVTHGGNNVKSDACEIDVHLIGSNDSSDIEFQLYCDAGSKASIGGWVLSEMKWIVVKIAFVNPETRQITAHKTEILEGETRCGKLLCRCRQSKLCFRKQKFCTQEFLQSFLVINKCYRARHGMSSTYFCSLDAYITVSLFPQNPTTTNNVSNPHELYLKSQHEVSKRIFHGKIGADFKLEANGQEFPCHKCILAGHSEVFNKMFTNESKRKPLTRLCMESMSVVGVESFLKYLYYGDTSFSQFPAHVALELMKAGELYRIPHLKKVSYEILNSKPSDQLDCNTALKIFLYASTTLQSSSLKTLAIHCFAKKYVELIKSSEFARLFTENKEIAQEILIKIHKPNIS